MFDKKVFKHVEYWYTKHNSITHSYNDENMARKFLPNHRKWFDYE